jgi:hypothetical protein
MNLIKLFGILCGMLFGATFVLLFNRGVRQNIAARSAWCATHPRGYVAVVTGSALLILMIMYLITVRFA